MAVIIRFDKLRRSPPRLVDGALVQIGRAEVVARMAADLVASDAFRSEREAIMALVGKYPPVQIAHLMDDARQAAAQSVVAKVMSTS